MEPCAPAVHPVLLGREKAAWLCLLFTFLAVPLAAQSVDGLDSLLSIPVSTGAKYAQNTRQVAGAITIVTSEDIRRFGYRTLDEILESLAGIYTSNDRNYSYLGVRGFGRASDYNTRTLVLVDGHTTTESIWGSSYTGPEQVLDFRSIDRVEVMRGPASALYGTGAMFAIINVITRHGGQSGQNEMNLEAGSRGRKAASVHFSRGSVDRGISFSGLLEDTDGQDVFYPAFDSPSTHAGVAHNLDWEQRQGATLSAHAGSFSLASRVTSRSRGISTGSYGMIFNNSNASTRDGEGSLDLKLDQDLSSVSHIQARAYADNYWGHGHYPVEGDTAYSEYGSNIVVGGEVALRWDPVPRNRLTMGSEYRWNPKAFYQMRDNAPGDFTIDQPFSVWSLYLQNEFQVRSNLTLLLGLRHDESSITQRATTPRVALLFDPWSGTTFKAMYGRAFRAPSLFEAAFPADSTGLGPEQLAMSEMIWIQRLGAGMMLTSSVYHYSVRGLIETVDDSSALILTYRNQDHVSANGLEVALDARFFTGMRGYLNYSWQQTREIGGDRPGIALTNSPAHLVKLGVASGLVSGLSLGGELRYESRRVTDQGTYTSPVLMLNGNVVWRPRAHGILTNTELSVRGLNLFNQHYGLPAGTEHVQATIPQYGRSVMLRLGYSF